MDKSNKRIYVKVTSDFDTTGYMQPRFITWEDGRVFQIDQICDFHPAHTSEKGPSSDCYTIIVNGEKRALFFERSAPLFPNRIGRWFVNIGQ